MAAKPKKSRPKSDRAKNAQRIDVLLLLDRTGSMSANWSETITAVNAYVQKMINDVALKARVKLVVFDKNDSVPEIKCVREWANDGEWRCEHTEVWRQYDGDEDPPRGMTPLYDAIGRELGQLKKANYRKSKSLRIQFVVMTDGHENASVTFKHADVKKLIEDCQALDGWSIVFLGAGIDAVKEGTSIGINRINTMSYAADNAGYAVAEALRAQTKRFAASASGQSFGFSDDQREMAMKPKKPKG